MEIEYKIGRDTLGTENSETDNVNFCSTVFTALQNEYPHAEISVDLAEHSEINVNDDGTDPSEIVNNIKEISNKVWGDADYTY